MTGNISYLFDFEEINGGYVAFGGNPKGGKITGKGKIKTGKLDFDDLPDENHVLLKVPRENNMYNVDLKNVVPSGDLNYLFAKATLDESNLWHRRTCHINFKTMNKLVKGSGPSWLFDIDTLSQLMNYKPVVAGNQPNHNAGIQENLDAGKVEKETESAQQYVLLPLWFTGLKNPQNIDADAAFDVKENDTNRVNAASAPVTAVEPNSSNSTNNFNAVSPTFEIGGKSSFVDSSQYLDDPDMPALEDIVYSNDKEDVGVEADFSNLETSIILSPIPTSRVHKDHHVTQIIGDLTSAPQTRSMARMVKEQDLPKGKRAIGSKWVFRNKKDERGIVIRNKARLVAQGHTQEEGIDYEEVFTPVAMIEAIWLFLDYASFMGFMVYQMDVKSSFLYGTIEEEVYVCQPLRFEDPAYLDKVYKVVKALYWLHQAPRAWYETLANYLLENGFQRGKIDQTLFIKKKKGDILLVQVYVDDIIFGSTNKELCKAFEKLIKDKFQMSLIGELTFFLGLQVNQTDDGIFISQDKYVAKILRKFGLTDGKSASTPIDNEKHLLKDLDGEDVDVHIYRYLKGKPYLGLWYPKDSSFNLVAYSDSDYAGTSLDRKSTIRGCQFLGCRLISWQCKKQTVVATSSTEAEY
nr:putative ribonuclease H-like domain-containing protein [Tanacetum cinerariifolium]